MGAGCCSSMTTDEVVIPVTGANDNAMAVNAAMMACIDTPFKDRDLYSHAVHNHMSDMVSEDVVP